MKGWKPEHIVIITLLAIVVLDMLLVAIYVLIEHHTLRDVNEHKTVIMFIIGVVAGWLGKEHINKT